MSEQPVIRFLIGETNYAQFRAELVQFPYWEGDECGALEIHCCDFELGYITVQVFRLNLINWLLKERFLQRGMSGTTQAAYTIVFPPAGAEGR